MLLVLLVAVVCLGVYLLLHLTLLRLPRCTSTAKLHGKTAIVTGANTGIGKTTALDLARRGARVILACRDRQRGENAVQDIVKATGNAQVIFMRLDLSSLSSVRSFVDEFLRTESRLDLLINNAGLVQDGRTEDGFGMIFGVNHLGHFLLTVLLLDLLKASGRSRVVTVASKAYSFGKVDFTCLTSHRDLTLGHSQYQQLQKYSHSKLCNLLFTHELSKKLQGSEVTCYSLHPGLIQTEIGRNASSRYQFLMKPIMYLFSGDAEAGAQTTLHCALQPGIEHLSGRYFEQCAPLRNIEAKARDDATSRKLWELSESFCGLS